MYSFCVHPPLAAPPPRGCTGLMNQIAADLCFPGAQKGKVSTSFKTHIIIRLLQEHNPKAKDFVIIQFYI